MKEHIILFGAGRYAKKIIQLVNYFTNRIKKKIFTR